jgi:hypothetical protein
MEPSLAERAATLDRLVLTRSAALKAVAASALGEAHWLGVVRFGNERDGCELDALLAADGDGRRQCAAWLVLGLSLGALLPLPAGTAFMRGLAQLFEEFDFYASSTAVQSVRSLAARYGRVPRWAVAGGSVSADGTGRADALDADGPSAPSRDESASAVRALLRFGADGCVQYQRLLPTHSWAEAHGRGEAQMPLSYAAVLVALCDVLRAVYAKLASPAAREQLGSDSYCEALARADRSIEAHALQPAARRLQAAAAIVLAARLGAADALLGGPETALAASLALLASPGGGGAADGAEYANAEG